jgi:hypothetical protein
VLAVLPDGRLASAAKDNTIRLWDVTTGDETAKLEGHHLLGSPPAGLDPYVMVTIRADSVEALLQRLPALGLVSPHTIMLPPLSLAAYRDVITKPAGIYNRQVARRELARLVAKCRAVSLETARVC